MVVMWPGKANGRIALSEMVDVVGDGAEGSYMNPAAAYHFLKMQAACLRDLGKTFGTEEAFRSDATQALYNSPQSPLPAGTVVAPRGQSKHGWGLANDITRYNDPDIWAWLMAHEEEYGFSWEEGKNSGEKWHHVYVGSLDTAGLNFDEIEDDMFTDTDRAEQRILLGSQARVELATYQIKRWLKEDGPQSIMGKLDLALYLLQGNKPTDPSIKKMLNDILTDVQGKIDAASDTVDKK